MKWSLKIAKVAGIKIYIHWTFLFLIGWVIIANMTAGSSWLRTIYALVFVVAIFACVVLHELGHALVAKHFKFTTKDIILLPIGGMARMDVMPEQPRQELLIAIAGPIVNFVIALLLWPFIYWFGKLPSFTSMLLRPETTFLFNLFMVNLVLGLFNLIPAFPMDGGRMLRAILAMKMTRLKATELAARTGQFISILFFFVGLFYNPFLTVIAIFIFLTAQAETEFVRYHSILYYYKVKDVTIHKFYSLDSSAPITDAVKLLLDVQADDFLVTEHGHVIGTVNNRDIIKTLSEKGNTAMVLDAMKANIKYLTPETPLEEAYKELQVNSKSILPVMENNEVMGIVDMNHILELVMVKEAADKNLSHITNSNKPNIAA